MEKPKKKQKLMVSHGGITHPVGAKCKLCERVKKEFENAKKKGIICKLAGHKYTTVKGTKKDPIESDITFCLRCGKLVDN